MTMSDDDEAVSPRKEPLPAPDLSLWSVAEIERYLMWLDEEKARAREALGQRDQARVGAERLFGKG